MSRRIGVASLLLLVLLFLPMAAVAGEYQPLTEQEAMTYMVAHPQEAAKDIIAYDVLEHVGPRVVLPETVMRRAGRSLVIDYQPPWVAVESGPLRFRVRLDSRRVENVFTPTWVLPTVIGTLIGVAAGAVTVAVLK